MTTDDSSNTDDQSARLLLALIVAHFLVDAVASTINPLWPALQRQTHSGDVQFLWLFVAWNLANSASQMAFGLFGDLFHARWLIWAGPVTAILCLSVIGWTESLPVLCLLVACAGMGVAAFHPEAASLAGNCQPEHRSRAISLFQLGGFLGQTVGPIYSGLIVDNWGISGLLPAVIWTLLLVGGLQVTMPRIGTSPQIHRAATSESESLQQRLSGVWNLGIVLVVGVLRIIPAAGVPMALAYLETARNGSTSEIGRYQAAFTLGIGAGGLLCGLCFKQHLERTFLWILPLVAAPLLWGIPQLRGIPLLGVCVAGGLLLGSTMPVLISIGQQLLPKHPRVGSSITMGLSWGLGGGFAGLIVMTLKPTGQIESAFPLFSILSVLSSIACIWLPRTIVNDAAMRVPTTLQPITTSR